MNQLFDIIDTLARLPPSSEAVLATVVKVEGSAYRQPSARMLILADGEAVGMVSGGCLEQHLVQRAFWLTRDGSVLKTYHTADDLAYNDISDNDEQEGFGLGCQGTISVLFERLNLAQESALITCFNQLKQLRQPQTLATIIESNTSTFQLGQHVDIDDLTHLFSDWQLTAQCPASRKSSCVIETYQQDDKQLQIFIETLSPPLQLVIFGAGQDCLPLIAMANVQGWQVTVIDSRLDKINRYQSNASATFQHIALDKAKNVQALFESSPQVAVVMMTHSVSQDTIWLTQALTAKSSLRYIGQLGPKYRTEDLLATIKTNLKRYLPVENLYYPVGLPLGGDTPEAVALSIVAQIQQVFYGS